LLSVCIPAYNQPSSVLRAVESVLSQKECDFEIIITDDSRDNSVKDALAFLAKNNRVKYCKNKHRLGAIKNWNFALSLATGKVKKILHHDDWFSCDLSLAKISEPILMNTVKVAFSACKAMSISGEMLYEHCANDEQLRNLWNNPCCLAYGNFLGAPSVLAFDSSLQTEFDKNYLWVSDIEFYIRLLKEANLSFVYLNEKLVSITTDSPQQISRECEVQKRQSFYEVSRLLSSQSSWNNIEQIISYLKSLSQSLSLYEILWCLRDAAYDKNKSLCLVLLLITIKNIRDRTFKG
jgi:glycosyltransferase involved in cell wall biosynthesis